MEPGKAIVRAVFGASLFLAALPLDAQQASEPSPAQTSPAPTLTVEAHLVNLPVIVRDKNGGIVTTLNKDDFAMSVDGRSQPIRYFDRDNNLPLTLGLLVDISGSVRSALNEERTASEAFLDDMMLSPAGQPPDQAFLIQFAREVDLLQDLSPSVPKMRASLNRVGEDSSDRGNGNRGNYPGNGPGNGRHGNQRGPVAGTTLYDAIYLGSTDLMQKQQGRKAIIVLTDGEDRGSMETLNNAIAASQRAETVVYAIYFKGEQRGPAGFGRGGFGGPPGMPRGGGSPRGGGRGSEQQVDGRKILTEITKETGGRMFEVSGKQTFAAIYTQIGEELRSQYRLGYVPDTDAASSGSHRVELTLPKDKKLTIQTRGGYYGDE